MRSDPAKRAKTDATLKGWEGEFAAAMDDAAAQTRVMAKMDEIIKGTYRVLLSRGRRGSFIWCKDAALREYLKDWLALAQSRLA